MLSNHLLNGMILQVGSYCYSRETCESRNKKSTKPAEAEICCDVQDVFLGSNDIEGCYFWWFLISSFIDLDRV